MADPNNTISVTRRGVEMNESLPFAYSVTQHRFLSPIDTPSAIAQLCNTIEPPLPSTDMIYYPLSHRISFLAFTYPRLESRRNSSITELATAAANWKLGRPSLM